jgi:hypothetical protein
MLPFYFLAERTGRSMAEVRAMPAPEFFSWLSYHGFLDLLAKAK